VKEFLILATSDLLRMSRIEVSAGGIIFSNKQYGTVLLQDLYFPDKAHRPATAIAICTALSVLPALWRADDDDGTHRGKTPSMRILRVWIL